MRSNFVYAEQSLSTSSLVLGSIFLVCGAVLRQRLPLGWDDIYSCLDAYLDRIKARTRVTFHFEKAGVPAGKIYAAALSRDAEEKFIQTLESASPLPVIKEAHSRALVRLAYTTLRGRPLDLEHLDFRPEQLLLEEGEDRFAETLESRGSHAHLIAAHSVALEQASAEALRARLYLVSLMRAMPLEAKWDVIEGDGGGAEMIRFGKISGDLFRAEYLSRL